MLTVVKCVAGFLTTLTLGVLVLNGMHQLARINEAKADATKVIFWHCGPKGHEYEKVCNASP